DLETYRRRIGDQGPLAVDFSTLRRLMRRQLFTVPFENFDVLAGREISLEPADLVNKLVGQQRGGYCYELNGLFAMALSA
ncbi:MAG: arylamine N-acetyltransferase, partial [Thiothrix sp.]|nr:arylamine N-acetyltransferase [Thiothrix sp.]